MEIIIKRGHYRYITDLDSIMKYMNEHYPLSEDVTTINLIYNTIFNNVYNLTNSDLRSLISTTIDYYKLAATLQEWIYQKHYTILDIKNSIDLLIEQSLLTAIEPNEETFELLRTWITEYLINDLVEKTSLQPIGLDALFG